jgi:anti-sigma factor RsiW
MKMDHHCRWVRQRLPLLIGGELGVVERRRVERHLIGCLACQGHREVSTSAFSALRAFAEVPPTRVDAPSLWPSLSDQIRQSRHVAPARSWWETPWPRSWAAAALAMGLIVMVATPLSLLLLGREPARPSAATVRVSSVEPSKSIAPAAPSALPSTSPLMASSPARKPAYSGFDPTLPQNTQINYDLDHGTPMGPGNRDPQHSY